MTSKTLTRCLGIAAGAAMALGAPSGARAQATPAVAAPVVTAHPLTFSMHTVTEITTSKEDDKPDKAGINQKHLFDACTGGFPTKTEGIYLFLTNNLDASGHCVFPPASAQIIAVETQPLTSQGPVGTLSFGEPVIQTTKGGGTILTAVKVPATINLSCNSAKTTGTLNGILDLNYAAFKGSGQICPMSGSMHFSGSAVSPPDPNSPPADFVIDDNSAIKINNRVIGITTVPGPS